MDFREYTVVREGDELVIVGTIRDPISWEFTIRLCEDDLAGMFALGANRSTFGLVMRWLFGRRPKHHKRRRRLPAPSKVEKLDCPLSGNRCDVTFRPASSANGAPAKSREVIACSALANPSNIDCTKACLEVQSSAA
jgi:hypothetical protein